MKNPNICRYIMYALIIIGWLIAGIAGVVFGVKPVHSLFVIGSLISFGALIFGIIFVRCPLAKPPQAVFSLYNGGTKKASVIVHR